MSVRFNEESHTYTHETLGEFISVTTLLSKYKKPFNTHTHAQRVADREGVSKEMVIEMWEKEKNKACDKGSEIHKLLENYVMYGECADSYNWLYKAYNKVTSYSIDSYKKVLCENLLYNEQYKIAGTADLIYDHGDTFTIADYKTNKKFRFSSSFDDYLLEPVSHLTNCEFNIYGLQMSLYAYLFETLTNKKCRKCVVFWLDGDVLRPYHISYMKQEILSILNHYKLSFAQ
jgi:ATP-dependent exoDNAse (exonuclease V) beta subunit